MTDNEKRAHDLAIAVLPEMMKRKCNQPELAIVKGKQQLQYKHFQVYFDLYSEFLQRFNETFTDS